MTLAQIKAVLKKQLSFFNAQKVDITDDTLHEEVFGEADEFSKNNPKLYKGNVLWTLWNAKHGKKTFPSNWMGLSVAELAQKLLIFILILLSGFARAQMTLNLSTVKTDLRQNAINIAFSYLRSLDSSISGHEMMVYGKRSWFMVTPEINFQTGTQDAFSSVIAKATGLFVKFRTTTVEGIETPDADKVLHTFPVSVGAETNNQFSFLNGIVEVGYVPFYQSATSKSPEWLKRTKIGFYLQGGYKFRLDSAGSVPKGGQIDESSEQVESALFRAKGSLLADTKGIIKVNGFQLGFVGGADLWYDFIHSAVYYRLDGAARIYLTSQIYFDLQYTKGSGAPNFNTGDQWGTGLTINF